MTAQTGATAEGADQLPLTGIRVADFSWFGAGPIAGLNLATFGAEVIRVESEAHLDGLRVGQPVRPGQEGPNVSGYYNNFNAGKKSFTLNMGHPGAREVALRLIAKCDVVLENYTPRVFEKWGLTYDDLKAVNPGIIMAQVPMQGGTGPHRDYLGFGAVLTPLTGYTYLTGPMDRPPTGLGTNYPDYVINPGHATIGILAALRYRSRTGQGQHVEISQLESTVATLGPQMMEYSVNGQIPERHANRSTWAAPHGVYPTAGEDRWLAIDVTTDEAWEGLLDSMGRPSWGEDERFSNFIARKQNEDELERLVSEWTRTLSAEDACRLLQAKHVPAGVVQNAEDVMDKDEHIKARGYYKILNHAETGPAAYDGHGARISGSVDGPTVPAPLLGEHNDYVLREIIGATDEEIADWIVEQIIF